jgi:hypothetical protein
LPSRGVVAGDVYRADETMNERVGALGEGQGVDFEASHTRPPLLDFERVQMMMADLWEPLEARQVFMALVHSYTGCHAGTFMDILVSLAEHAGAIGVFTERQRWDGVGMSVREAQLEEALRDALGMGGHAETCPAIGIAKGECECGWAPVEGRAAALGVRA